MKQDDFLALIAASQTTIKQDLLNKHPESKYQLLMLSRSFDLIKQYLLQQDDYDAQNQMILSAYLNEIIANIEEGKVALSQSLRHQYQPESIEALKQLNKADLKITHPKAVKDA